MGSLSSKIGKEFFGAHSATQGTLTGLLNQFSQLGLNCQQGGGSKVAHVARLLDGYGSSFGVSPKYGVMTR